MKQTVNGPNTFLHHQGTILCVIVAHLSSCGLAHNHRLLDNFTDSQLSHALLLLRCFPMKILLGASMYCYIAAATAVGEKQHIVFLYIAGWTTVCTPLFTERYMYLVEPFKNFSGTSASNSS